MKRSEDVKGGSGNDGWIQKRVMGRAIPAFSLIMVFLWNSAVLAYEINDKLSIGGVMAGAYQYQSTSPEFEEFKDSGRGAFSIQPEISFTPTDQDQVFVKLGFAAGTGVNGNTPFLLAPRGRQTWRTVSRL